MLIFNSSFTLLPSFFLPSTTKIHPTPKNHKSHHQNVAGRHDNWILGWELRTRYFFFLYFFYFFLLIFITGKLLLQGL